MNDRPSREPPPRRRAFPSSSESGTGEQAAPRFARFAGRHVTLCVTGSVAAYKAALLLRLLREEGADVDVVMTESARKFVGEATFAGLSGRPVYTRMFDETLGGEIHVELGKRTDLVLIVPATADTLARLAGGRADELVTSLALCTAAPVLVAPAMHPSMWSHPATQRNVKTLAADGRTGFVGPVTGAVASGDSGLGRMAEPEVILAFAAAQLSPAPLRGRHLVVTAGPTAEDIDPVRSVTNRSSGKMGFALAARAAILGARVTLIAGPVSLPTPVGVHRVDVRAASAMQSAIWQTLLPDLSGADALIMAAAVADYRPAQTHAGKLKRDQSNLMLELVPNPDLLSEVGHARQGELPVLIGFALETDTDERVVQSARNKLMKKRVDLVVANHARESLGRDDIRALLVSATDCEVIEQTSKEAAADRILGYVAARLRERKP
jgi:phosphopantothenoylcysteine decarboxylase/phosphopantothenate--cysteine ligase